MAKKVIVNVLFYIVVVVLVFYLAISFIMPSKSMDVFGFKTYVVVSGSMEPKISKNDLVVVVKRDIDELEIRDIISFEAYLPTNQFDGNNNRIYSLQIITHYIGDIIVDGDKTIYKTQGSGKEEGDFDNWTTSDGENPYDISYEDIIGEVRIIVPYIGLILNALSQPIFLFLIIFNGTIIYIIIKVIKKSRKELIKNDVE